MLLRKNTPRGTNPRTNGRSEMNFGARRRRIHAGGKDDDDDEAQAADLMSPSNDNTLYAANGHDFDASLRPGQGSSNAALMASHANFIAYGKLSR
mmetsp:Transcript_8472/g.28399  ORF Transcript_8472/g.28399 Transcript_8472/m.28399 type:complete len:95 (-) Transcript_8472:2473-2757(-)